MLGQQRSVNLPCANAEESVSSIDSTFFPDDCDLWPIHVLRLAVDLNMLKTKVAAARGMLATVPEQWLVLC